MKAKPRLSDALSRWTRPRVTESLPIKIDRRRVYVLPTRFGLFYLLLVATMGIGALNYNNNPALLLGLLLAGTGLASLVAAHLQLSGLQADTLAAEPVPAGLPMPLRIAFSTADTRPRSGIRISAHETDGGLTLDAHRRGIAELMIPTTTRGWMEPGRIEISTTRPLGLARAWSVLRPADPWLVYPSLESHGPPLPDLQHDGDQRRPHFAGDDLHLLRNYQAGDPLRSIAWKASARRDQLMARTWEQPHGDDVVLDWFSLDLPHEDRIRRLAHWVDLAEREGRRWQLRLPQQPPIGPASGAAHRHECLRALALMQEAHGFG